MDSKEAEFHASHIYPPPPVTYDTLVNRIAELEAEIERLRYDAGMYHAMCNKLWTVVQPNEQDDCASIAAAEIERLRGEVDEWRRDGFTREAFESMQRRAERAEANAAAERRVVVRRQDMEELVEDLHNELEPRSPLKVVADWLGAIGVTVEKSG